MKKTLILLILLTISVVSFGQNDSIAVARPWMSGLNIGFGVPAEFKDLYAAGVNGHVGYDFAYPLSDKFAIGFYTGIGGGFLKETEPYGAFNEGGEYGEFGEDNGYDSFYYMFKFSAGLLMEIGDLHKSPFVLGVSPCTGLGFLDMDLFLPVELRLGHVFNRHWYIMTDIVYGVSLAEETMFIEPSIRVGYNFGHKPRTRKK